MTDQRARSLARRTLAGSAAVLAATGALNALRAENGVQRASAATGQVPVRTVPSARGAAWTAAPLATSASRGHAKHRKKHKKAVKPKVKTKPKPAPAPAPTTPTTPTTPSTPVA